SKKRLTASSNEMRVGKRRISCDQRRKRAKSRKRLLKAHFSFHFLYKICILYNYGYGSEGQRE
ncbi:MAG: hypothetical protein J5760_05205, partial [Clostridia bacterium]|nr:hypothetical protein [Clostridia bacterium]